MTDNEIINALKCCVEHYTWEECSDCIYKSIDSICIDCLLHDAIDLINRKKAEIAELQSELIITKNDLDNAKERYDEAVKIGQKMNEKLIDAYKKLQTAKSDAIKTTVMDSGMVGPFKSKKIFLSLSKMSFKRQSVTPVCKSHKDGTEGNGNA